MIKVTDIQDAPKHFDEMDLFISILDPGAKDFKLQGPKEKHFIARFEDTEHPSEKEWMQMQKEVRGILRWVRQRATLDTKILVHCRAGISRSPAVAWLIQTMLGVDPKEAFEQMFKARSFIWPNTQVLQIGATFLDLDPSFMQLVKQVDVEICLGKRDFLGYGG